MSLTPDEVKKFAAALSAKGVNTPCSRCGNRDFGIEGYSYKPMSIVTGDFEPGGPVLQTVVVSCGKCGFLMEHGVQRLLRG
jgi:ribosomal protein S27AE